MNNGPNNLLDALDVAAALLLEKAGVGATMNDDKSSMAVTVTEQVKAFEAVVDWAKTRKELRPPQKEESRFDGIKREFSAATARRGSKSKGQKSSNRGAATGGTGTGNSSSDDHTDDA